MLTDTDVRHLTHMARTQKTLEKRHLGWGFCDGEAGTTGDLGAYVSRGQ
jgi:hypothetical protein